MILRIVLALSLFSAAPASASLPRLDGALASLADSGRFSGAVAIIRGGRLVYAKGFGLADAEQELRFEPDTIVETGSVAKPVTATAVLLLAEQQRLDLDEPVQAYLPEFPHGSTTVRHLLMHSAGLPDYGAFDAEMGAGQVLRTVDLLDLVRTRGSPPLFPPGTAFSYCNLCYDTLALLVERVTGETYERFVRRHLLEPTGARRTFLRPARFGDWNGVRIRGYRRTSAGVEPFDVFDNEGFYGGSNLYFSAVDLAAWMAGWAGRNAAMRDVRERATATVGFPDGRSGLTLGNWYCSHSREQCYYPGHHQGFHAFGYWDERRNLAVAFVSNGALSPLLQTELPRLIIGAAEGQDLQLPGTDPPSPPTDTAPGTYDFEDIGSVAIFRDEGGLRLRPPGTTSYRLVPIGPGQLYAPGLDVYLLSAPGRRQTLIWSSVFLRSAGVRVAAP